MTTSAATRVAQALATLLDRGLPQETDVLDYMAATHGDASPGAFADVLADRDSPEAATLAGLLLFPGRVVRESLEPELSTARLSPAEAREVASRLEDSVVRTTALLPDGVRVSLELRPGDLTAFVARLRLERTPPRELASALDESRQSELPARLSSMLRHCRLEWTGQRVSFIRSLLGGLCRAEDRAADHARTDAPEPFDVLAFALAFLDAIPAEAPPLERLGRKHAELSALLRRAADFHAALARSSFEIMLAQGARVSLPHPDCVRREIALLDAVCLAAAGVPAWTLPGASELDMGTVEDGEAAIAALGGLVG